MVDFREQLNMFSDSNQWLLILYVPFGAHLLNFSLAMWVPTENEIVLRLYHNVSAAGSYDGLPLPDGSPVCPYAIQRRVEGEW